MSKVEKCEVFHSIFSCILCYSENFVYLVTFRLISEVISCILRLCKGGFVAEIIAFRAFGDVDI